MAKLTQKALADLWNVDPSYVCRLVKKGCPLDSLNAANEWREMHRTGTKRSPATAPAYSTKFVSAGDFQILFSKAQKLFELALNVERDNPDLAYKDVEHLSCYCLDDVRDVTIAAAVGIIDQALHTLQDTLSQGFRLDPSRFDE